MGFIDAEQNVIWTPLLYYFWDLLKEQNIDKETYDKYEFMLLGLES